MSLFRRHKHTWGVKMVQPFTELSKFAWQSEWDEIGDRTIIRYVCSGCKRDTSRTVHGDIPLHVAKEVFPKP